ncbi:MAG: sulfotransferase [Candidatus Eremiobacteraeota bacterium]|nr:sulfotransferase [Candidatus Eremiobacteraeota bacterium]
MRLPICAVPPVRRKVERIRGRIALAPMKRPSRSVVILGMHRSGTSAVARGLQALGVYLGNDFLDAQPENPTGYWEDRRIVDLNERALKLLHLKWDDVTAIGGRAFSGWRMWALRRNARRCLRREFIPEPLWGFKDPRTLRLLPFWLRALREIGSDDSYVLVIRNPASVAASLHTRQRMDLETAHRLWLVYVVPFLGDLAAKRLAVVDYDRLMRDPRKQLERIADKLDLPGDDVTAVNSFVNDFLDARLQHTLFSLDDIDVRTQAGCLTRDAYALLDEVAADRRQVDGEFWRAWGRVVLRLRSTSTSSVSLRSG